MSLKPQYETIHDWEFYASNLPTEYVQSTEEGLDLSAYEDLFTAVARLPKGEEKKAFGDLLFRAVQKAATRADYPYNEPSDLAAIRALCRPHTYTKKAGAPLADRVHGAWLGRVCGGKLDVIGNFSYYDTNAQDIERPADLIEDVTGGEYTVKYNWNLF